MADRDKADFLSDDTEQKIAAFEAKLNADKAKMPDTSIRSVGGGIAAPENCYFDEGEPIPIYDSGTNKQIDRIDMEISRLQRTRRTQLADEVDKYMAEIRAEILSGDEKTVEEEPKTMPFIYIFPGVILVLAIIFVCVRYAMG